jgi:hypothetical protein
VSQLFALRVASSLMWLLRRLVIFLSCFFLARAQFLRSSAKRVVSTSLSTAFKYPGESVGWEGWIVFCLACMYSPEARWLLNMLSSSLLQHSLRVQVGRVDHSLQMRIPMGCHNGYFRRSLGFKIDLIYFLPLVGTAFSSVQFNQVEVYRFAYLNRSPTEQSEHNSQKRELS